MTLDSIKLALSNGHKVCFKTSRYEVFKQGSTVMYKELTGTVNVVLDEQDAKQCFIKPDWND